MKLFLIDGTYELFRTYYGAPSAFSPSGVEVGAVRGLLRSLFALMRDERPDFIAAAFDHEIESFRNKLFDGYKTGEGIEHALLAQFSLAEAAVSLLGITVWPMLEFEADDALATAAARFASHPSIEQVLLCSPDKDLAQCVEGDKVVMWDRKQARFYNEAGVVEKFGVSPASIPDYLALVGDSADGIPGVPRWGAKSSAAVLAKYQSIERIPRELTDWQLKVRGAESLVKSLCEHESEVTLYKQLATLRRDVPLQEELDDLRPKPIDLKQAEAFLQEIGDTRFLSQLTSFLSTRPSQ
ncbi:MAG: flap endonuclease [Myxococcales bacterium]|nr:MAG: flap endonuclease [Myxococcales bacterium]